MTNTTQLSWERALEVFDARLADIIAPEHIAELGHWRETVAQVHSDFMAKLPEARVPALASRASWEDGRTEGSQYPNLMRPGVMIQYYM